MAKQRQTVDIAAIKQQAEERGREAGRAELAVELMRRMDHDALRDLWIWLKGLTRADDDDYIVTSGRDALQKALSASAMITEEATNPAF